MTHIKNEIAACEGVSKARRFLHAIGEQAPSPNARRC